MNIIEKIESQILKNPILLYIKGSPEFPKCGFSDQAVQIISKYYKKFSYINILEHPDIRIALPKYANWPTFPQLWILGKLIGGCDIIIKMDQKNELKNLLLNAIKNQE